MNLTTDYQVKGDLTVNEKVVNVSFAFKTGTKPESLAFTINEGMSVSGTVTLKDGITHYNSNSGIIDSALLLAVENACKECLTTYTV